jgi:hypothetical protein
MLLPASIIGKEEVYLPLFFEILKIEYGADICNIFFKY